jgi:glutamyl-tRNA synthetase
MPTSSRSAPWPARRDGRFAPSPTGRLHLGNLRTGLAAWLSARSSGGAFVVRMEDLDRVTSSREHAASQLRDLAALGIDWDGPVVFQSERFDPYDAALERLTDAGLTYPCYCSRAEIRAAASAPHALGDAAALRYPGTCRDLSARARAEREAAGRRPAIRLRAGGAVVRFVDRFAGPFEGEVDDLVLRRNDGVPAYNLAVVVDDAAQHVTEVLRADDLLTVTPGQIHIAQLLDLPVPKYTHIPLAVAGNGERLAKRHGAVTLADLAARGDEPPNVLARLAHSLGLPVAPAPRRPPAVRDQLRTMLSQFDVSNIPRSPWIVDGC